MDLTVRYPTREALPVRPEQLRRRADPQDAQVGHVRRDGCLVMASSWDWWGSWCW